jgi:hypothetical protein
MALFQRVGGRRAVFYLVPLLGGLCVWMTASLGGSVHEKLTGVLAALLVATSPSFVTELMAPASDVAATAWWTTALVLTIRGGPLAALGAGAAVSLAVLTRPNLVPLAVVLGVFHLWRVARGQSDAIGAFALFTCAVVPGCLAVAAINHHLYGSPFRSGYEVDALYALANAGPNLDRYPRWLMQTQTPFIILALAAPLFSRSGSDPQPPVARLQRDRVVLLLSFAGVIALSYLFYRPYGREEWEYLRFLLPAYPPLLVLAVAVAFEIAAVTRALQTVRAVTAVSVCVLVAGWQARESFERGSLTARLVDQRYVDVGRFVDVVLPENSVVFASLHAGSIRYYSGRQTLNYDRLERRWLDDAVAELTRRGSHPFIALEEGEIPWFRDRFSEMNELGRLDWPPMAERREPIRVRIYDPADRDRARRGEIVQTQSIPLARH